MLFLCDIDGTVADVRHRRPFVSEKPKNWRAFNAAAAHDTPMDDVISVVSILRVAGHDVVLCSGRDETMRELTVDWLKKHAPVMADAPLYMRAAKDNRRDDIVKGELLDQIIKDFGVTPTMAFDDRNQVVAMWRSRGITCAQVAEGDF